MRNFDFLMNRLVVLSAVLILGCAARAESLPRVFTITPTAITETPSFLSKVVVPDANCAAVSDALSILVVGRAGKDEKHLAVFRLDAEGRGGEPTWITLPKPDALAANFNYPLGLLFHPKLPLLYVWQDVNGPPAEKQGKHPEFANHLEFDHLAIYAIKDGALELMHTGTRGAGFHCGVGGGTVGLDFDATHLFVPNATGDGPREGSIAVFALDEEGLPEDEPEETPGKKSKAAGVKARVGKDVNGKYNRLAVIPKSRLINSYLPTGMGWFAALEALVMGGYSGCLVNDVHDGGARQAWFHIPGDLTGPCAIAGHPTQPALYICLQDHNHFYQIAQTDGYPSLLPQIATVTGAHMAGIPVVVAKQSCVAIGDTKSLHLLGLDAEGRLNGKSDRLKLDCGIAKGLAYSEKHGRLYVAVNTLD